MRKLFLIIAFILFAQTANAANALVQSDTGGTIATANDCTGLALPSTATAGNTIITILGVDKDSGAITVPTGFTLINDIVEASVSHASAYKISNGTETTISWTFVTARTSSCWAGEYSGLTATPLDVSAENNTASVVTSLSAGTTATTAQAAELAVASMACDTGTNCDGTRAWSNSFSEISFLAPAGGGAPGLSVATKTLSATGTVESTYSVTDTGDQFNGGISTFKETVAGGVTQINAGTINAGTLN